MQIKNALLSEIGKDPVLCIRIELDDDDSSTPTPTFDLPVGHTEHQWSQFLESVDMSHCIREVKGTIWYQDGFWATTFYDWDRCEGGWERHWFPEIPEDLK